jgi:hypothetical protein
MKTTPLVRLAILLATMVGLLLGLQAFPHPAHAAIRGTADVCVLSDTPRSWTRGLEKAANRKFSQRVEVTRVREDHIPGRCDVLVWVNGRVAEDYVNGTPAVNPWYDVYTGPYAMTDAEINLGSITPRNQRRATLLEALDRVIS